MFPPPTPDQPLRRPPQDKISTGQRDPINGFGSAPSRRDPPTTLTPTTSAFPKPSVPFDIDIEAEAHDRHERTQYFAVILAEITSTIGCIIKFTPESSHQWARLTGDDWNRHPFKSVIINYLKSLRGRINERGNKSYASHRDQVAHMCWDAGQGVAQIQHCVEQGLPVLHEKMAKRELILMGAAIVVPKVNWGP
ncbi:hypothetical protein PENSPDRAFT_738606 [Peniophora sp. CONT]|nr:hypothetical protein PENSPDRAFT_738606 [Peniophora sp. CONT]